MIVKPMRSTHSTVIKLAWHVKHSGNMATTLTSSDSHMSVVVFIASVSVGLGSIPAFLILALAPFFTQAKRRKPCSSVFLCSQPHGNACYAGYVSQDTLSCPNDILFLKVCHLGIQMFLLEMSEELPN